MIFLTSFEKSGIVLGQAINDMGSISANWVLVGVTGVAATLFWMQLKDIKETLKSLVDLTKDHDTEIELIKQDIKTTNSNVERITSIASRDLANHIITQLKVAAGGPFDSNDFKK